MDGNRRFAKARGLEPWEGHAAGKAKLKEALSWGKNKGLTHLICYAFSTENWNRPKEEVDAIEALLIEGLTTEIDELIEKGVRLQFVGDRSRYSKEVISLMEQAEAKTHDGQLTLAIALSYGGRAEIVAAANAAAKEGVITETSLSTHLWTAGIPEPELIIRTGGQRRLSNFLLWQSAYSELFFIDALWPEFTEEDFTAALTFYADIKRNFGK